MWFLRYITRLLNAYWHAKLLTSYRFRHKFSHFFFVLFLQFIQNGLVSLFLFFCSRSNSVFQLLSELPLHRCSEVVDADYTESES